jgi:hypothetical protein
MGKAGCLTSREDAFEWRKVGAIMGPEGPNFSKTVLGSEGRPRGALGGAHAIGGGRETAEAALVAQAGFCSKTSRPLGSSSRSCANSATRSGHSSIVEGQRCIGRSKQLSRRNEMDTRTVGSLDTTATQDIVRSCALWRSHKLF